MDRKRRAVPAGEAASPGRAARATLLEALREPLSSREGGANSTVEGGGCGVIVESFSRDKTSGPSGEGARSRFVRKKQLFCHTAPHWRPGTVKTAGPSVAPEFRVLVITGQ